MTTLDLTHPASGARLEPAVAAVAGANQGPEWLRVPEDVNALVPQFWPANAVRSPRRR